MARRRRSALEESELRIERHLASLLALPGEGEGAPMPSLRLIQAPVFHGYSFSAWVEFEANPGLEALESGLAMESIEVRGDDFEPPTNVGQAGQGGIAVGAIIAGPQRCRRLLVLAGGRQSAAGRRERRRGGAATGMKRFAASAIAAVYRRAAATTSAGTPT